MKMRKIIGIILDKEYHPESDFENDEFHRLIIESRKYVLPDRAGYHPEKNNPKEEIRADLKALEDKAMHTTNLKKHRQLKEALANFTEAHEDIL